MISVYLECGAGERDALIAELHECGTLGILELSSGLRAWFEDGIDMGDLARRYDGEMLSEDDEDWLQRTRESFPPLAIGERFWLAAPWNRDPVPPGRMRLEINPGMACGTGWHQCTQLCLEAMERYVRPGDAVLDVGTGSGILIAAADLLKAGPAVGCDIDATAVAIAAERVGSRVFVGSADAVSSGAFNVIVANISAAAATALLPDFDRIRRPGGHLILSGFTSVPEVPGVIESRGRDGWHCIVCGCGSGRADVY